MSLATRRAIYGKMAGDTTLNGLLASPPTGRAKSIYYEDAPQAAAYPYIVFFKSAGTRTWSLKEVAMKNELWTVKGVSRGTPGETPDSVDAIADRLEALLTDAALSVSGAAHLYLRPETDIDYPEKDGDQLYRHAGAVYRLVTDPT